MVKLLDSLRVSECGRNYLRSGSTVNIARLCHSPRYTRILSTSVPLRVMEVGYLGVVASQISNTCSGHLSGTLYPTYWFVVSENILLSQGYCIYSQISGVDNIGISDEVLRGHRKIRPRHHLISCCKSHDSDSRRSSSRRSHEGTCQWIMACTGRVEGN